MGTYTSNYNLFMPSIGEQGWGTLVNGNFETIDTTMTGLNTRMGTAETNITSLTTRMGTAETTIASNKSRIGTLETETDALDERITVFEENISFDDDGNIVGNASTATQLNKVVTVSPSTNSILPVTYCSSVLICPYVPGVLYTGTLRVKDKDTRYAGTIDVLSSDNVWSSISIGTTSYKTITITNAKCVYLHGKEEGGLHGYTCSFIYAPIFT